jgi:hypothetical protein
VSTIRSGITNVNYFLDQPDVLAYGMLCAMLAVGIWMMIATYWEVGVRPVPAPASIFGPGCRHPGDPCCAMLPAGHACWHTFSCLGPVQPVQPHVPSRSLPPLQLPVSSTQAIVASIAGMTIVAEGFDAVVWSKEKDTFPYLSGMSAIVSGVREGAAAVRLGGNIYGGSRALPSQPGVPHGCMSCSLHCQ